MHEFRCILLFQHHRLHLHDASIYGSESVLRMVLDAYQEGVREKDWVTDMFLLVS